MNALELAELLENTESNSFKEAEIECDAATMLRRQHEAIKELRGALIDLHWYADQLEQIVYPVDEQDTDHDIQAKAKQALESTKEFV